MKFYVSHFEKQNSCHNGFESPPMRDLFENKMAANKRDSPNNPNGNQLIFLSCTLKTKSSIHDGGNTGFILNRIKFFFQNGCLEIPR